jgi:endonuclease/exonuclease/phosphatase family metal-dependent hydrolase
MRWLRSQPLDHDLAPHYAALAAFRDRRALHASALWRRIGAEVARVLSSVERGDIDTPPPPWRPDGRLRVVAWNIQRGGRFAAMATALRTDPILRAADVLLLVEVDCGLGRSGNRNVPRDLALALGMSYAFAPSYLTIHDDWGENPERTPNTTALAGTAVLTRWPIRAARNLDLPELRDKFSSRERRLGKKRALLVEIDGPGRRPWHLAACHLDSNASPADRVRQLVAVLDAVDHAQGDGPLSTPALVGGDFNSSTHDLSSGWAMTREALRALFVRGLGRTVARYMRPEASEERGLFEELAERGFSIDGFNDLAAPTYHYDFADPYARQKLRRLGGPALVWLARRLLRRWQGRLPAHLDWLAGRGLRTVEACVVTPQDESGTPVSDHAAVTCEVELAAGETDRGEPPERGRRSLVSRAQLPP